MKVSFILFIAVILFASVSCNPSDSIPVDNTPIDLSAPPILDSLEPPPPPPPPAP